MPFWAALRDLLPGGHRLHPGREHVGRPEATRARACRAARSSPSVLSIVVYIGVAVVFAAALPGAELVADYARDAHRSRPSAWLIDAGVIAATLSSALASFLGAPRILQSLAADRVFPLLGLFAAGSRTGRTTRAAACCCRGAHRLRDDRARRPERDRAGRLDVLPDLLRAAQLRDLLRGAGQQPVVPAALPLLRRAAEPGRRRSPAWRRCSRSTRSPGPSPRSRCSCSTSTSRAACGSSAGPTAARSHRFQRVRDDLLAIRAELEHPRDWRPVLLAFSDDPERRERLLFVRLLARGRSGLTTVVRLLEGEGAVARRERKAAEEELASEIEKLRPGCLRAGHRGRRPGARRAGAAAVLRAGSGARQHGAAQLVRPRRHRGEPWAGGLYCLSADGAALRLQRAPARGPEAGLRGDRGDAASRPPYRRLVPGRRHRPADAAAGLSDDPH